jgi:hypothetical protein
MNLLTCLHRLPWPFAPVFALAAPHSAVAGSGDLAPGDSTDAAVDAPHGCGWFDSSHELQQGLLVREHSDPAVLAAEMPLGPWLELHLSTWRPALAS